MKPWQKRLLAVSLGGGLMLVVGLNSSYRRANNGGIWDDAVFWSSMRPSLLLAVVVVLFLAFERYD